MQQKTLVLFDFDGTLTRRDTLSGFLLFAVPPARLFLGGIILIFRFLGLIWSGIWSNQAAKETLLSQFFKGFSAEKMQLLGANYYQEKLPSLLRPELMGQLREYRANGATVSIVSASPDIWLRPFCLAENIGLICTELEYANGVFSGRFSTPNCNGHEKAVRIQQAFDLNTFEKIIAYGNSPDDAEMLMLANEAWLIHRGMARIK